MSKNNNNRKNLNFPLIQLDAALVLLGELLQQVSKDKKSVQVVREKVAVVLVVGGNSRACC